MLHISCDLCGKVLQTGQDHYVVKIEVFAQHDPAQLTDADLEEDHMEAISQILAAGPPPPPPPPETRPIVYIERALINPSGPDGGREIVVLSSLATTAQTLTNWRLLDKNARTTPINTTLGPGGSVPIPLDGTGVQLGNQGGTVTLQDDHNIQVDVVTYTAEDASTENRYVRFRR